METPVRPKSKSIYKTPSPPSTPSTPRTPRTPQTHRETNFTTSKDFINDLSVEELCSLVGEVKLEKLGKVEMSRLGKDEKEEYLKAKNSRAIKKKPETFKVEIDRSFGIDPSFTIAAKIMEDTEKSRNEIEWYTYFIDKNYPNFPRTYAAIQCDVCSKSEVVKENCIVLFSELADGDLQSLKEKMNDGQIESMIRQVLNALLLLEKEEVIHGDLNFGNLLGFQENKDWNWRLWDFEMMRRNGEVSRLDNELKTKVDNTFEVDWKSTFLPKLKQSPFVRKVSEITDESNSIAEVISKL